MVVTAGEGVVRFVSGSGVDEMAGVDVLDDSGAVNDVLPPPHAQHATAAVLLFEPIASAKSVLHKCRPENDAHE